MTMLEYVMTETYPALILAELDAVRADLAAVRVSVDEINDRLARLEDNLGSTIQQLEHRQNSRES
jgi:hypothetical protein